MASGTGLLDMRTFRWHPAALDAAMVDIQQMPELVSPYQIIAKLSRKAADLIGLTPGTAVIPAAGDGPLANVGGGRMGKADMHLSLGTSAAVRVMTPAPVNIGSTGLWCYALDNEHWVTGGSSNNGASVQEWFFNRLQGAGKTEEDADRCVQSSGLRPTGMLFYPYIHGERSLFWNSSLRGALLGITGTHGSLDFVQAAMEGVAFHLKMLVEAIRVTMRLPQGRASIVCSGGGWRWKSLESILANVLGEPLLLHKMLETSARGACVMAQKALGYIQRLEEAQEGSSMFRKIMPDSRRVSYYSAVEHVRTEYEKSVLDAVVKLDCLHKKFSKARN